MPRTGRGKRAVCGPANGDPLRLRRTGRRTELFFQVVEVAGRVSVAVVESCVVPPEKDLCIHAKSHDFAVVFRGVHAPNFPHSIFRKEQSWQRATERRWSSRPRRREETTSRRSRMNTDGRFQHVRTVKGFEFCFGFPSWLVLFVLSETEHTTQTPIDAPSRFLLFCFVSFHSLFDVFGDFW